MTSPILEASKGFLSTEDLTRLTGYEAGQRQRIEGWLRRHGYVYEKNARGEVLVLWEHLREKLCQAHAHEEERVRPNFEAAFAPLRAYHEKRNRARLERERAPSASSGRSLQRPKPAT